MCVYDKEKVLYVHNSGANYSVYVCVCVWIRGNVAYGVKYIDWATTFEMCC